MTADDSSAIPAAIREQLTHPQNVQAAVKAIKLFLTKGDEEAFEKSVALYCASAQGRKESVEAVLAVLTTLARELEQPTVFDDFPAHPTTLHARIFAGILRAFYGNTVVDREVGASAQRKADAPQHSRSGTWPIRPA